MTRQAVAYVRRSSGTESPLSLAAQTEAVSAAAAARGDSIARAFTDWGRSGGDRTRPEFMTMLEAIEAGSIGAVYSYDTDRLSRRESTLHLLLDAAEDTRTAIVERHGRDLAGREKRLTAGVLASVDAQVLRDITDRNRANRDRKAARGDDFGEPPYGWRKVTLTEPGVNGRGEPAEPGACVNVKTDPDAILTVLNAYVAAGSAHSAAQLLNAIGHPTKRATSTWNNRNVHAVVEREAPELLPARLGRAHARHYRTRILSGLVRCYCGHVMSPNGTGWTCSRGFRGLHSRPYNVADAKVLPFVRAEMDRLEVPYEVAAAEPATDERAAIEAKRRKVVDLYLDDAIGKPELDERLAELDAAMARLDAQAVAQDIPQAIDWTWSPSALNDVLRSILEAVVLDEQMRVERIVWRRPTWRRD